LPGGQHVQRDANGAGDVVAVGSPVVFLAASVLAGIIEATRGDRSVQLENEWAGDMSDPDAKMHVAINELADLNDETIGTGRWIQ
jgi:hypothetical protein